MKAQPINGAQALEYEGRYQWDEGRGESHRPFRLYDPVTGKNIRWRCYGDWHRAFNAALIEVLWIPVGATIEIYDCRTMQELGQLSHRIGEGGKSTIRVSMPTGKNVPKQVNT